MFLASFPFPPPRYRRKTPRDRRLANCPLFYGNSLRSAVCAFNDAFHSRMPSFPLPPPPPVPPCRNFFHLDAKVLYVCFLRTTRRRHFIHFADGDRLIVSNDEFLGEEERRRKEKGSARTPDRIVRGFARSLLPRGGILRGDDKSRCFPQERKQEFPRRGPS